MFAEIKLKRIYEEYEETDGFRILIDRLWPRGIKKEKAQLDLWLKEIAPSNDLRKWFGHKVEKWEEFSEKYIEEIENNLESQKKLIQIIQNKKQVTLLFGTKDKIHNQAVILKDWLSEKFPIKPD